MNLKVKLLIFFICVCSSLQAKFDATIPVIDLQNYYSTDRHQEFIQELSKALQTVGFVAITNTKINQQILDNAYKASKEFYNRPLTIKLQANKPEINGQRGYVQSETAKGANKKDYKEFYHIARDYPREVFEQYGYMQNVWPNDPYFKDAMQKFIIELDKYVVVIGEAISESIAQPKDFLTPMITQGDFLLRTIHYPSNPPQNSIWANAHTDIDLFTILPKATDQGLQVLNADNEWIDVVVPDDAFIINAGDMLQNITNGVYKSAKHRVICKGKNRERYSIVAFVHLRPQDRVDPLPQFIAKVGKREFANVTGRELLYERLIDLGLHSPELLQEFAQSGAIERLLDVNRASPQAMQALRAANLASARVIAALE